MIYIVTALYAEAHPFIIRFQLKKDISHTHFQVFLNSEANICLIISGPGSIPAAVAISSICTEYGAGQGDFLLNVGVCAQIRNTNTHGTERPCQPGNIFLCSKIMELTTGKTFYPDILYRHKFAEAQIITGIEIYENSALQFIDCFSQYAEMSGKPPLNKSNEENICLYDMEAAAIYQAGSYYLGPHQMSFLKVISDDGNAKTVSPEQIKILIDRNMESIAEYIINLQTIAQEECQNEPFRKGSIQKDLEKLCLDLHCSRAMSESVRQYIHYCILSDVDYVSVLDEMYRNGKLPCKDKREGKKCFEDLKERLL